MLRVLLPILLSWQFARGDKSGCDDEEANNVDCEENDRRRRSAVADAGLCSSVNEFVSYNFLDEVINTLRSGESMPSEGAKVAKEVNKWCSKNEARRRLGPNDGWGLAQTELPVGTDKEYLDAVIHEMRRFNDTSVARRRNYRDRTALLRSLKDLKSELELEEATQLPAYMYSQCAGYAYATMLLIDRKGSSGAHGAADFAMNNRGDFESKAEGCGAIVNSVNAAARAGDIPGLSVVKNNAGRNFVAVNDDKIGLALGLTRIGTAMGTVFALFEICLSYNSKLAVV